jgi:hypothetical protein
MTDLLFALSGPALAFAGCLVIYAIARREARIGK